MWFYKVIFWNIDAWIGLETGQIIPEISRSMGILHNLFLQNPYWQKYVNVIYDENWDRTNKFQVLFQMKYLLCWIYRSTAYYIQDALCLYILRSNTYMP